MCAEDPRREGRQPYRSDASGGLWCLPDPPLVRGPHQLLGDTHLATTQLQIRCPQSNELAPSHPRVHRHIDESPEVRVHRFPEDNRLLPREEHHVPLRNAGRINPVTWIPPEALLVEG